MIDSFFKRYSLFIFLFCCVIAEIHASLTVLLEKGGTGFVRFHHLADDTTFDDLLSLMNTIWPDYKVNVMDLKTNKKKVIAKNTRLKTLSYAQEGDGTKYINLISSMNNFPKNLQGSYRFITLKIHDWFSNDMIEIKNVLLDRPSGVSPEKTVEDLKKEYLWRRGYYSYAVQNVRWFWGSKNENVEVENDEKLSEVLQEECHVREIIKQRREIVSTPAGHTLYSLDMKKKYEEAMKKYDDELKKGMKIFARVTPRRSSQAKGVGLIVGIPLVLYFMNKLRILIQKKRQKQNQNHIIDET